MLWKKILREYKGRNESYSLRNKLKKNNNVNGKHVIKRPTKYWGLFFFSKLSKGKKDKTYIKKKEILLFI